MSVNRIDFRINEGDDTRQHNSLSATHDDQLIERLRAIAAERTSDKLYLRADGKIAYERVVQVMGALNGAGFSNIVLVTDAGGPEFGGRAGN